MADKDTTMTDKPSEPIDLLKRRTEKLLEKQKAKKEDQASQKQLEWSGSKFRDEAALIQFSDDLLDRLKIMMCVIAANVKEATSIQELERPCFGLALLLLKEHDLEAYKKLLELVRQGQNKD
jgi:hypothetical protein